jgi:hypothetical protein
MLEGVIAEELLLPTTVAPVLLDADFFPSAVVSFPGVLLPSLYLDIETFFSLGVFGGVNTFSLSPQSVVTDADVIFAFTGSHVDAIAPALFQSSDVFYQATTPAALGLQLLVDTDRFYGAQNTFNLGSAVVASDDNIRAQIFQYGTTWRTLSASVVDADLFLRPDVSWPVVSAALVDADIFYAPNLPYYLRPGALASDDAIFTAGIGRQVLPGFVTDTEQFFGPSIPAPIAPVTLPPGLVVDIDNLIPPTVLQPGILVAPLYSDTDVFLTPTITTGAVSIVPSLFTDTDIFAAPLIVAQNATFIGSEIAMVGLQTTYIFNLG